VLFEPTADKSLRSTTATRDYLVLKVLEHVRTKLVRSVPMAAYAAVA
jgi:prolyl oligopeptidase PreP (S9A serine peptidase family)